MDPKETPAALITGINGVTLSPALLQSLFPEVLVPLPPASPAGAGKPKPATEKKDSDAPAALLQPAQTAVEGRPAPPNPAESMPAALPSLGGNRRRICLLVAIPGKEVLPAKSKTFLEKMLAACGLGIEDLAIVNTSLSPAPVSAIAAKFAPEKWLLAGIPPEATGMDLPATPFQILSWQGASVLSFPALAELDLETPAAKQLKRRLWTELQTLFGL